MVRAGDWRSRVKIKPRSAPTSTRRISASTVQAASRPTTRGLLPTSRRSARPSTTERSPGASSWPRAPCRRAQERGRDAHRGSDEDSRSPPSSPRSPRKSAGPTPCHRNQCLLDAARYHPLPGRSGTQRILSCAGACSRRLTLFLLRCLVGPDPQLVRRSKRCRGAWRYA